MEFALELPTGMTAPTSGPRVCRIIRPLQAVRRQMRINLSRNQMLMPKQLLHAAQISSGIQQVRSIAVPQLMRCELRIRILPRQDTSSSATELLWAKAEFSFSMPVGKTGASPAGRSLTHSQNARIASKAGLPMGRIRSFLPFPRI